MFLRDERASLVQKLHKVFITFVTFVNVIGLFTIVIYKYK